MKKIFVFLTMILILFLHFREVNGMVVSIKPDGLPAEKANFIFQSSGNVENILVTSPDGISYEAANNADNKITIFMESAPSGEYRIDIRGEFTTFSVSIVSQKTSNDSSSVTASSSLKNSSYSEKNSTLNSSVNQESMPKETVPKQKENADVPEDPELKINVNNDSETLQSTIQTSRKEQSKMQPKTENIPQNTTKTEVVSKETLGVPVIKSESKDLLDNLNGDSNTSKFSAEMSNAVENEMSSETVMLYDADENDWIPIVTIPELDLYKNILEIHETNIQQNDLIFSVTEPVFLEERSSDFSRSDNFTSQYFVQLFFWFILFFFISCFLGSAISREKFRHVFRREVISKRK